MSSDITSMVSSPAKGSWDVGIVGLQAIHRLRRQGARAARASPPPQPVEPGLGRSPLPRSRQRCRMLSPYRISWAALLEAANFQAA